VKRFFLFFFAVAATVGTGWAQPRIHSFHPQFTDQKELLLPDTYRQWVSVPGETRPDCAPSATFAARKHSFIDHIYIEPSAYKYYLENGDWPDKAVIVMEVRKPRQERSTARSSPSKLVALEVAVKDETDSDHWSYFAHFSKTSAELPEAQPETILAHSHPTLRAVIEGRVPIMDTFF